MSKLFILISTILTVYNASVDKDVIYLAKIINAECGICGDEEMYLVGSVVLNRAELWDITVEDVISQPRQFCGYNTEGYVINSKCLRIAKELIKGKNRDYNVLYFFRRDADNSKFVDSMIPYICKNLKYHTYAG